MRYKIKVYQIMDPGMRKDAAGLPHQEDSMFPPYGEATDSDRLFVLCDGMGGHDAGEVASATVCEAMSTTILAESTPEGDFTPEMLQHALDAAFDALDAHDTGATRKMGTTMTMLKLYDQGAVIAHMGDSRVYHIRPGADAASTVVMHRTWDHSLVFDMIRAGILTEEEAKHSPQKNVITRAMQPNQETRPTATITKIRDIRPGDYFYLCSDGMLEQMDSPELCAIFAKNGGDNEAKRQTLIDLTKDNRDNHTAFIIEITEVIDPVDANAVVDEFDQLELQKPATMLVEQPVADVDSEITLPMPQKKGNRTRVVLLVAILVMLAAIAFFAYRLFVANTDGDTPIARPERVIDQPIEPSVEEKVKMQADIIEKQSDSSLAAKSDSAQKVIKRNQEIDSLIDNRMMKNAKNEPGK